MIAADAASEKTAMGIVASFLRSYNTKPDGMSDAEWLDHEFAAYPDAWESESERRSQAEEVAQGVVQYRKSADELERCLSEGKSSAKFLEESISRGCKAGGIAVTGRYMASIDAAIGKANRQMAEAVFVRTPDGALDFSRVNMCPNLNGNIAEAWHAGTFNIDAAVNESSLHAEVPSSHGKNSVDILVKDGVAGDDIVGRYQSKYGADAAATEQQFGTRYRGQRKLVPEGQSDKIAGATDHIEKNGVKSKPLSKEKAVEMQKDAQSDGKVRELDWNDANLGTIGRSIGKKALISGMLAVGFQGARIVGRRMVNAIAGRKNRSTREDMKEFVDSAVKSGAGAAGVTALTGGIAVAAKKGLLGTAMKSVKGNVIANVVCAGVENSKILYKLGKGEISGEQAVDLAGRTNSALIGSLAVGAKGAALGATVGMALGPVGAAVGGFVGGVVGGIAGSIAGEAVYEGAKKICRKVSAVSTGLARGVVRGVGSLCKSAGRFLRSVFG